MKKLLAVFLALLLLALWGCGQEGEYVPTGDGLSYDENYTGPMNTRPEEENDQVLTLPYYAEITTNDCDS